MLSVRIVLHALAVDPHPLSGSREKQGALQGHLVSTTNCHGTVAKLSVISTFLSKMHKWQKVIS